MSQFLFLFNENHKFRERIQHYFKKKFSITAPWLKHEHIEEDFFSILIAHNYSDRPRFIRGKDFFVFLEGEIYDDKIGSLFKQESPEMHDIGYIEDVLRNNKKDKLCSMNGNYVLVAISREGKDIIIANDSLGSIHVYYGLSGSPFFIGTCIEPVLKLGEHQFKIDKIGLLEALCIGGPLYCRTIFDSIELMPPGSCITFHEGFKKKVLRKTLSFKEELYETDLRSLTEAAFVTLKGAISKRLRKNDNIMIPLSGGLDSRILAGLSVQNNLSKLQAITIGRRLDWDLWVANKIANHLNINHEFHALDEGFLWNELDAHASVAEGNSDVCYAIGHPLATIARKKGACILTGFVGDTTQGTSMDEVPVTSKMNTQEMALGRFDYINRRYFRVEELSRVVETKLWKEFNGHIIGELTKLYAQIDGSNFQKNILIDLLTEQRRQTGTHYAHLRLGGKVYAPYTDTEYLRTMLSMPPGVLNNRYIIKQMIIRYFPSLSKIMIADDRSLLQGTERQQIIHASRIIFSRRMHQFLCYLGLNRYNPFFWTLLHGTWTRGFNLIENYVFQNLSIFEVILDPHKLKMSLKCEKSKKSFRYPGQIRLLATLIKTLHRCGFG